MFAFDIRRWIAVASACCACAPAAWADAVAPAAEASAPGSPFTVSGHLDIDAMRSSSDAAGSRREASVLGQWGGSFDTAAAGWWPGGLLEFSVEGVRANGTGSAGTGAVQLPSNEWAANFLRIYQLTYAQALGDTLWRVGVMDLNQYFESSDVADLLHNGSFGMAPNFTANTIDPSFPTPGLGLMGNWAMAPGWQLRGGIWQSNPPQLGGALHDGALSIGEVERDWGQVAPGSGPRTDLKVGAWHYRLAPGSGPAVSTAGGYLVGETRWSTAQRQWGAFVLAASTPAEINVVTGFLGAGVLVTGPFAQRPQDQFSVGFGRVNQRGPAPETFVELVYAWQLTPSVSLQPDVQWFDHPGGGNPNALVAGVRMRLTF